MREYIYTHRSSKSQEKKINMVETIKVDLSFIVTVR